MEHEQYDVLHIERNGHCLFLCFVEILRARRVEGAPSAQQEMRNDIADYFDDQGGTIWYQADMSEGALLPPDENIRTNGYGGFTEIIAFAAKYGLSVEVHSPETPPYVQLISYGLPGDAPELLLQTLGWDGRTAASVGDHWQRLRRKAGTAPAPAPDTPAAPQALTPTLPAQKKMTPSTRGKAKQSGLISSGGGQPR